MRFSFVRLRRLDQSGKYMQSNERSKLLVMTQFQYQKLRAPTNNSAVLQKEVLAGQHCEGGIWGVFAGLFGPASNEIILLSSHADADKPAADSLAVAHELWQPTVRPQDATPCSRDGLYVFRRFHVREADVEEVVALSQQAWTTFETNQAYAAEPQGLFRPAADADGIVRMMLLTWYDGFSSWEISRRPAPEAADNFQRRHALTLTTYAIATRLLKA